MSFREERIARNNAIFRAANERIRERAESYQLTEGPMPFICECANEECTTLVRVPLDRYREVRRHPRRFLVARGHHERAEGKGRVIEETAGFVVFEKTGLAGELVEEQ